MNYMQDDCEHFATNFNYVWILFGTVLTFLICMFLGMDWEAFVIAPMSGAALDRFKGGRIVIVTVVSFFIGTFLRLGPLGSLVLALIAGIAFYKHVRKIISQEEKDRKERQDALQKTEAERVAVRDADFQKSSYTYQIGRHANETLALRYGIANTLGSREHREIRLRKLKKIKPDFYEVELSDFGGRRAIAVIEEGTEYVKTFYPQSEDWFEKNEKLEMLLKNNSGLSVVDIAKFHIENELRR
jgi:hypothetical protein